MLNGAFVRDLCSGGGGSAFLSPLGRTVQAWVETNGALLLICDAGVTKLKTRNRVDPLFRFGDDVCAISFVTGNLHWITFADLWKRYSPNKNAVDASMPIVSSTCTNAARAAGTPPPSGHYAFAFRSKLHLAIGPLH